MNHTLNTQRRRAVAPIIATLLMVAIAVVGGILIFVFAQGFFSDTSIQGPTIDSIEIFGYDARDTGAVGSPDCPTATSLATHFSTCITAVTAAADNKLSEGDGILLYVRNTGAKSITIETIRMLGTDYVPDTTPAAGADFSATIPGQGEFSFLDPSEALLDADDATDVEQEEAAGDHQGNTIIEPGEEKTIVIRYDGSSGKVKTSRNIQVVLTTGNGATFSGTIIAGVARGS